MNDKYIETERRLPHASIQHTVMRNLFFVNNGWICISAGVNCIFDFLTKILSTSSVVKFDDMLRSSKNTIHQLQKQIEIDQSQITKFQKLIDSISAGKEDAYD